MNAQLVCFISTKTYCMCGSVFLVGSRVFLESSLVACQLFLTSRCVLFFLNSSELVQVNEITFLFSLPSQQEQPPLNEISSQPVSAPTRPPISKCGDLVLSLEYRPDAEKLLVSVIAARDIPDKARSGMDSWQVHMVLLPSKKQRHKTSVQKGSLPHFNETFRFSRLDPSELHMAAVRFRLYALGGRMSRERMMGEKLLRLGGLDPDGGTMETTLVLEPRSNLKVTSVHKLLDVVIILLAVEAAFV